MILPPHHTFNFLSLSIEKSIKCRTGPGNDFVAICKFGHFPQRLQKQNANDLWDNIPQKDKWEADEGLPWSAPQYPSQKTDLLPYMGQFLQDGKFAHFVSLFFSKSQAFVCPNLISWPRFSIDPF